ncbi:MAG: outer membrane lipoprotein-sorting protein [Chitinispirillaceae bacterium]
MKRAFRGTVLTVIMGAGLLFAGDRGTEIARKYFDLKSPRNSSSKATMLLTKKNGSEKTRSLLMYGKKDKTGTFSFIEFESPADVKGTKLLSIPKKDGGSEQRIYLPALRKARLIASSGKGGRFVGSDFYYYDMEDREFEDFTYKFLREEKLEDKECQIIQMTSRATDTPYSKAEAWVSKKDNFVYKMKLYDRKKGQHEKTMEVLEAETIDGCIIPTKVLMTSVQKGTRTMLTLEDLKVNKGVDDKVFSIRNLESR